MKKTTLAMLIQEGGKLISEIMRAQPRHSLPETEATPQGGQVESRQPHKLEIAGSIPAPATKVMPKTILADEKAAAEIATACLPCSVSHFSTCVGLLNEATRFKKEGLASNQVMDDMGKCIAELNALERVDLTPEKIQMSKGWEKPIAKEALQQSRNLRHRLESVERMEDLEQIAADTQRYYTQLNRQWYKGRFRKMGDEKAEAITQRVGGE